MSLIQSIILGIVQGITEFLPISSSGHLILMPRIFGWQDQGLAFDTLLHLATAAAILVALRKDIRQILTAFKFKKRDKKEKENSRLLLLIIIAIIPAGIIGFLFNDLIEHSLRLPQIVAFSLIFWAVILWFAEVYSRKQKNKTENLEKISLKHSLLVGFMQIIALIPGTSRSGITITGGLFSGLNRQMAVKFSFLVGLPLIIVAGIFQISQLANQGIVCQDILPLVVGFFSAFLSGLLAIHLLLWLAARKGFKIFIIYRIILGIIILIIF